MKLHLSKAYSHMLAEKAMELANAALVGIVFVQFLPNQSFSATIALFGVLTFICIHISAYFLMQGGD